MSVINICLGAYAERDGRDMTVMLYESMRRELVGAGVEIGLFDWSPNKGQVSDMVASGKYDVVICQESLSGDSLGAGTIREWKSKNPRIKIILIINKAKCGGKKLESLFESTNYYDACYDKDLSGIALKNLITTSRTREEAFAYYGLAGRTEGAVPTEEAPAVEQIAEMGQQTEQVATQQPTAEQQPVVEQQPAAVVGQATDENDETLDEALERMEHLFSEEDTISDEKETGSEVPKEFDWENASPADDQSIFGDGDLFSQVVENSKDKGCPEDAETEQRIFEVYEREEKERMSEPFPVQDTPVQQAHVQFASVVPVGDVVTKLRSVRGVIQEVMDEQLLLVRVGDIYEDISCVQFTLLVNTGQQGRVENGRYKSGRLSINAYGNCFLEENLLLLEVVDCDLTLIAEQISNKECSLIIRSL